MKILAKFLFLLGASFLLTACEKPFGLSGESSQNNSFKGEFSMSNSESKGATNTNKTTIKASMLTNIVSATTKTADYINDGYYVTWKSAKEAEQYKVGMEANEKINNRRWSWLNGNGSANLGRGGADFDETIFNDENLKAYKQLIKLPSSVDDWFMPMDALIQKYYEGDLKAGHDFLLRRNALFIFLEGITPTNAWVMIKGLSEEESQILYINRHVRAVEFSNLLASELVRILPKSFKNPADIRHDLIVALLKIPNESIYAMFKQASNEAAKVTFDNLRIPSDGGGNGAAWNAGTKSYIGSRDGWVLKNGGQTIFGEKNIGGQTVDVEVSSSLEISKKIEKSNRMNESTSGDQSTKSSVNVK